MHPGNRPKCASAIQTEPGVRCLRIRELPTEKFWFLGEFFDLEILKHAVKFELSAVYHVIGVHSAFAVFGNVPFKRSLRRKYRSRIGSNLLNFAITVKIERSIGGYCGDTAWRMGIQQQ